MSKGLFWGFINIVVTMTLCADNIQHLSLNCHQKNHQLHLNSNRETEQSKTGDRDAAHKMGTDQPEEETASASSLLLHCHRRHFSYFGDFTFI